MATENLLAKLQFDGDPAIAGMKRASRAFGSMRTSAATAQKGIANLRAGFAGVNIAMVGAGVAAGATVKKYADFADAFGTVKAVLGAKAAGSFTMLEDEAKRLGATTVFTATQSANAMENLARAGLAPKEIMDAIGPTLAAAAAEGMDLATAADIVASNMRAFGMEAHEATRIADALAFVSRKTNTDMIGLQEGMKFAAPVAKQLGVNIEDTAASLGVLADVGLKGTLAGTALKNALLKLAKNTKRGEVSLDKYKVKIGKTTEGNIDLALTMNNLVKAATKIKDPMARAAAMAKLLGLRGIGAAGAFGALSSEKADLLFNGMAKSAKGTADEMQKMRLDTIKGDFVLLQSAIDGAAISIGSALSSYIRPLIKGGERMTKMISDSGIMIAKFWGAKGELGRVFVQRDAEMQGWNKTVVSFSRGLVEGIKGAVEIFKTFFSVLQGVGSLVGALFSSPTAGLSPQGPAVGGMTKLAIQAGALALSMKVTIGLFSRFSRIAVGTFQVVKGALGAAKGAIGGTVNLLATKMPMLARVLPRGLSKLTGAVSAAEKITANPVRVVNWDEMRAGGLFGRRGGVMGAAPDTATTVGRTTEKLTRLDKAARIAGHGIAVVAAALAGWQIGKWLDEQYRLSSRFSDWLAKKDKRAEARRLQYQVSGQKIALGLEKGGDVGSTKAYIRNFAVMASKGLKIREASGKQVDITRELVAEKARRRFKGAGVDEALIAKSIEIALNKVADKIPSKADLARQKVNVTLKIHEKEIAKAVAESGLTDTSRGKRPPAKTPTPRTKARR